jgi:hypothetical protein
VCRHVRIPRANWVILGGTIYGALLLLTFCAQLV